MFPCLPSSSLIFVLSEFLEILLAYRRAREAFDTQPSNLGQDRRVFERVHRQVNCRLANPMFGLETLGTTVDISLDGLGVVAPINWSQGSRVRLWIDDIGFEAAGLIVFRKEETPQFRYGIRFTKTGIFQILKLRRFLQQNHSGRLTV